MQIAPANATDSAGAHAAADLLLQQAQAGSKSKEEAKIEKAGRDFESILLGSWLQGAEQSFAAAPGGPDEEDDDDGSHNQFMGMAMQQLAGTLVASGGIGISKMIVQHLEAATAGKAAATGKAGEPVVKARRS
jgi:Rod binding domain-containing protein